MSVSGCHIQQGCDMLIYECTHLFFPSVFQGAGAGLKMWGFVLC